MTTEQLDLFPESATVVDEKKRRPQPKPRTRPEWRKLAKIKGRRGLCSACVLERWRRERSDVNRVTYRRTDPSGDVLELCSEHADSVKTAAAARRGMAELLGGRDA